MRLFFFFFFNAFGKSCRAAVYIDGSDVRKQTAYGAFRGGDPYIERAVCQTTIESSL